MNIKHGYVYFFLASAVAVALRTLMLLTMVDTKNGFIMEEYSLFAVIIFVIIAACFAFTFIFSLLSKKHSVNLPPSNTVFKIVSLLLAAVILYDTFSSSVSYSTFALQRSLEFLSAVVAAAALIGFVVADFLNTRYPPLLMATPILFWFFRLVIIFTSFSTLANISDNIFELASLCLILISSQFVAKLVCIETDKKTQNRTFAILLLTTSVCFVNSIPRAIIILSGQDSVLHTGDLPVMTPLVAGIYFLVFAFSSFAQKNTDD